MSQAKTTGGKGTQEMKTRNLAYYIFMALGLINAAVIVYGAVAIYKETIPNPFSYNMLTMIVLLNLALSHIGVWSDRAKVFKQKENSPLSGEKDEKTSVYTDRY